MKSIFKTELNDIEHFKQSRGITGLLQIIIFGVPAVFLLVLPVYILLSGTALSVAYTVGAAALIGAVIVCARRIILRLSVWCAIIFVLALFMRLLCLKYWPLAPQSDNLTNLELSLRLASAPLSDWQKIFASSEHHYIVWSMHTPFVAYQALVMKLFGHSLSAIQCVNAVFSALTCVLAAVVAKSLWGDRRAAVAAGLLLAVNPTSLLMSAFITNQHVGTVFFLLAIYIFIEPPFYKGWKNAFLCGLSLAASHLMRPEMYITAAALVCWAVYILFGGSGKRFLERLKGAVLPVLSIVAVFFLTLFIADAVFTGAGFAGRSILAGNLKYKLAVGLNQETEGRFLADDYPLAGDEEAVSALLAERISGPWETTVLMARKLLFQFSSYNYWWLLRADKGGPVRQMLTDRVFDSLMQSYMMFILFLAFLRTIKIFKRHSRKSALLYIIFIGFMAAFALVEVQQRYNYLLIPVFTAWAAGAATERMLYFSGGKA